MGYTAPSVLRVDSIIETMNSIKQIAQLYIKVSKLSKSNGIHISYSCAIPQMDRAQAIGQIRLLLIPVLELHLLEVCDISNSIRE